MKARKADRFWSKETDVVLRIAMVIVIVWALGTVTMLALYFAGVPVP